MDTSHNYLREPNPCESSFLRAKGYLSDLSKVEKEVLLSNLGKDSGKILVENFPDEEDLTQKMQGSQNVLKFKDKIFNPEQFSGLGKVFLRKNIVRDVNNCGRPINILTQDMFEDEHGLPLINTIFIIQYNYDLDKGFITIPENSVLVFAGGSLSNGTVILNNTLILPAALDIEHFMSVNIRGTYREGSLVYLRKHLRLFNGRTWVNLEGISDLDPKHLDNILDIVAPFKIELTPAEPYLKNEPQDIKVSWKYNRIVDEQKIRIKIGNEEGEEHQLRDCDRKYIFKSVDPGDDTVSIMLITTYKGKIYTEELVLEHGIKITIGDTTLLLDEEKLSKLNELLDD